MGSFRIWGFFLVSAEESAGSGAEDRAADDVLVKVVAVVDTLRGGSNIGDTGSVSLDAECVAFAAVTGLVATDAMLPSREANTSALATQRARSRAPASVSYQGVGECSS